MMSYAARIFTRSNSPFAEKKVKQQMVQMLRSDDRLLIKRKKEKKQRYKHVKVQRYGWYQQITRVHVSKAMAEQIGRGDPCAWAQAARASLTTSPLPPHLYTGSIWRLHLSY